MISKLTQKIKKLVLSKKSVLLKLAFICIIALVVIYFCPGHIIITNKEKKLIKKAEIGVKIKQYKG